MLSAISLLGQIAMLLAKRLKSVDFNGALDGRGAACGSLTRLYYLLVELKSLTAYISERAKFAIEHNNPVLFAFVLRNTKRRIRDGANDFAETFHSLEQTLDKFVPDMAGALSAVASWKVNLLQRICESTVFEQDAEHLEVRKLKYLKPNERLLNLDVDACFRKTPPNSGCPCYFGECGTVGIAINDGYERRTKAGCRFDTLLAPEQLCLGCRCLCESVRSLGQ